MRKNLLYISALIVIVLVAFFYIFNLNQESGNELADIKVDNPNRLALDAHQSNSYTDDLPGLMDKRTIRVLTTLNRTNFFISDGDLVGYEYSVLKKYEDFLNRSIDRKGLKMSLEFVPVARDELIPKLNKGYGDIAAAGLTITEDRKKKVAFSNPYLNDISEIIVTNHEYEDLENLSNLSGKVIYVRKSSSYFESLENLNRRLQKNGKDPVIIETLGEEIETEGILEMVNSGAIDITVSDSHIAEAWSKVLNNIIIHEDLSLNSGSDIAWMVRKENPGLRNSLNGFLKNHKKGTMLGNIYFSRYFEDSDKLQDVTAPEDWQKLKQYRSTIQKYATQYNFDWLLILAMAYQESGLDHSQKSSAGALGLMQVLPSTAMDKNIDIGNINNVENNVHAGVKYLSFLRDRYFSKEENMSSQDKVRMTLASYNAGPAKIRRVRALAEKMGLDKNTWFRNTELAALRVIGQETVRYVNNINKYYNLYQTIVDQKASTQD